MTELLNHLSPAEILRVQSLATRHPFLREKLKDVDLNKVHADKREKHPLFKPHYRPVKKKAKE